MVTCDVIYTCSCINWGSHKGEEEYKGGSEEMGGQQSLHISGVRRWRSDKGVYSRYFYARLVPHILTKLVNNAGT